MTPFNAFLLTKNDAGQSLAWVQLGESDLMEGDVTVRVSHSTINYKDGLALTGKAPVVRDCGIARRDLGPPRQKHRHRQPRGTG